MSSSPFDVIVTANHFKRAGRSLPSQSTRRRTHLHLTASVLALALAALTVPAVAQQTGGNGGGGAAGGVGGATSAADGTATDGADASTNGGGGGGGAGGGNGGNGGDGSTGGAGGATAGADGSDGAQSGSGGHSGGGGGAHGAIDATFSLTGPVTGGNGGRGGQGSFSGWGGGGGGGGYGVFVTGAGGVLDQAITGGNGGNGANSFSSGGGDGGAGGVGVFFSGVGSLINTSAIQGGNGGVRGVSGGSSSLYGSYGAGGAGVAGANLTIDNRGGTISGGMSGDGVTRADAITFTGGANTLTLAGSGSLTGNIGITAAGSTLTFAQGTDLTLANRITGLGGIIYSGLVTPASYAKLTLTGDSTYSGGTTVSSGKLIAASNTALGTGAIVVADGATLQLAGMSGQFANAITINGLGWGQLGALQSDYASASSTILNGAVTLGSASKISAGGTLTFNQTISGINTNLMLAGAGRFVVNGDIAIGTGGLTVLNRLQLNHVVSYAGETRMHGGSLTTAVENVFSGNTTVITELGGSFSSDKAQSFGGLSGAGGRVEIGGSGLTVGAANLVSIYSGVISSYGTSHAGLTKVGTADFLLDGINAYTGATTVDGGMLSINGSIASSSLTTVNAGGTLGGTGFVGNTTINGGMLAPGNSIGTLTVSGSLTMTAASTYLVEISGNKSDLTVVTGTANLAGTVTVKPLAHLTAITTYTIVNAGALTGTFDGASITNFYARNPRLSYVGGDVLLTLDPGLLSPILPGNSNANQRSVAAGVDNALLAGSNPPSGFNALFGLGGNQLQQALTQISGETATGSQQTAFDASNMFMGMMTDPFAAGRGEAAPGTTSYADEAMAYAGKRAPTDAFASMHRTAPMMAAPQERWNVWAAGFGGSQTTDGNAATGSNNSRSSIYGMAVGADRWLSPFTVAGFSMAGGGTNFSVDGGGSGRSDLFQVGGFVRHTVGSIYVTAAAAYGWQDITTDRTVTVAGIDQLRANFNANSYSGRVEVGNRFVLPLISGVGITPYVAAQVTAFDLPSYAESIVSGAGTFALAYNGKTVTATRSELGLRSDKSFAVSDAMLTLRGRAAWAHDYNVDRSIAATFQSLPGASFTVNGAASASDAALTTASAELKWTNGWAVAATFEGEFSDVTKSYAGKGVVRYAW